MNDWMPDYNPRRVIHLVDDAGWYLCPFGFIGIEPGIRATWLPSLATCPRCLQRGCRD